MITDLAKGKTLFSFGRDKKSNTISVTIGGDIIQLLEEHAADLELNEIWPIIPIALQEFCKAVREHKKSGEDLRELAILSKNEKNGVILCDLEELKIIMKKMELNGLDDDEMEQI